MSVEIVDKGWEELLHNLQVEEHVKVGVLGNAGNAESGLSMAELAMIHEFGTDDGHVPARAPIQTAFRESERDLVALQQTVAKAIYARRITVEQGMELIGQWFAAEVKKTITEGDQLLENASATIEKKGSERPLIDTGRLVNAYTYEVE